MCRNINNRQICRYIYGTCHIHIFVVGNEPIPIITLWEIQLNFNHLIRVKQIVTVYLSVELKKKALKEAYTDWYFNSFHISVFSLDHLKVKWFKLDFIIKLGPFGKKYFCYHTTGTSST